MEDEEKLDITTLRYVLYARKSTDDPERQATSILLIQFIALFLLIF